MVMPAGLVAGTVVAQRHRLADPAPVGPSGRAWRALRVADGEESLVVVLSADDALPAGARALAHELGMLQGTEHPLLIAPREMGPLPQGGLFAAFAWPGTDTLAARVARQGVLPVGVVVQIGSDLLEALHELHQRGILARGVTARDVVLVLDDEGRLRGQLVLAGMIVSAARGEGVAGVRPSAPGVESDRRLDALTPEHLRGERLRPESDVWAVAAVLFEALAGVPPFEGDDIAARLAAMGVGPPMGRLGPSVPEGLARVLRQSLALRVEARPPDADAMRFALRASVPSELAPVSTPPRAFREEGRSYVARAVSPPVAPSTAGVGVAGPASDLDDLDALVASMHAEPTPAFVPSDHPGARGASSAPPPASTSRPPIAPMPAPPVASFDLDEAVPSQPPVTGVSATQPRASSPPAGELGGPASAPLRASASPRASTPSATPAAASPRAPSVPPAVVGNWASVADEPVGAEAAGPVAGLDGRVITRIGAPPPRRMRVSVPVAAAAMFAVTVGLGLAGWETMHPPTAAPVRGTAPTPVPVVTPPPVGDVPAVAVDAPELVAPPREENPAVVDFGEQTRVPLPAGIRPEEVSRFVRHVVTAALPDAASVRGFAACVEGRVFLRPAGLAATVQEIRAAVRCEGQDLALVPDLDGDGRSDVAAIDARRTAVLVLGSRGGRTLRQIRLPGVFGLAAGLRLAAAPTAEPGVVAFVSPGVGGPSLVALGLRTGRVVWRTASWVHPGDPVDLGLSVGPDLDGDHQPDVAFGLIEGARRCVLAVSGATGESRWRSPQCQDGLSAQGVALGSDIDEDGTADVVVNDAEAGRVRVLSGRSGLELRRVQVELGHGATLAGAIAAAQDLTRDGFPSVILARASPVGASVEVYSTNDGHRVGGWAARAVATLPGETGLRVQFAEGFPFEGARSVLAATPDGVVCLGAGRRTDEGLPR